MSGREQAKMVSRRRVVSFLGLAVAAGFGALTVPDAEAQTTTTTPAAGTAATPEATGTHGMQRRQGRRTGRHERRHERRTGHATPAAAPAEAPAK
jgi:hypothetical protein